MAKIVVNGASGAADVPGIEAVLSGHDFVFADNGDALSAALPGAEILLGMNFRGRDLPECWPQADSLKWIHWCGAGVDAVLFPELAASDVVLTNARGCFDRAMAEYVLGMMLVQAKGLDQTIRDQDAGTWNYRWTEQIMGTRALIYGVGSIAREIAQVLQGVGIGCSGVGRTARDNVPVFGKVYDADTARALLEEADWVIGVLPGTAETRGHFDAGFFDAMKPQARFYNLGRGSAVDETALADALNGDKIAGAGLDVFATEPLPKDSVLWTAKNIIVSPHMSGDFVGHREFMVRQFLDNLERYGRGEPLVNVVDKQAGYVRD